MDDEFDCPDCGGTGEVQCINLREGESDYLPCPTCIAHERNECEERLRAENAMLLAEVKLLRGANLILHDINEAKSAENANLKKALGQLATGYHGGTLTQQIARAALNEGEKSDA